MMNKREYAISKNQGKHSVIIRAMASLTVKFVPQIKIRAIPMPVLIVPIRQKIILAILTSFNKEAFAGKENVVLINRKLMDNVLKRYKTVRVSKKITNVTNISLIKTLSIVIVIR